MPTEQVVTLCWNLDNDAESTAVTHWKMSLWCHTNENWCKCTFRLQQKALQGNIFYQRHYKRVVDERLPVVDAVGYRTLLESKAWYAIYYFAAILHFGTGPWRRLSCKKLGNAKFSRESSFFFSPAAVICSDWVKIWVMFLRMRLKYGIYSHPFLYGCFQKLAAFSVDDMGTICISICKKATLTYFINRMAHCTLARGFVSIELCSWNYEPFSGTLHFRIKNSTLVFIF